MIVKSIRHLVHIYVDHYKFWCLHMNLKRAKAMSFLLALVFILAALPMPTAHSSEVLRGQGMRTRGTIIVNASGGGDYTHIQRAIDNASDGDTVFVEVGTYYENVILNKSINFKGAGQDHGTIIDGSNSWSPTITIAVNWVNVTGFNVTNGNYGIEINNASYCTIKNNLCYSNSWAGIGLTWYSMSNNIISNIATDNQQGISLLSSSNNNVVTNNTCSRMKGVDIYLHSTSNNLFINNTMGKNGFFIDGDSLNHWNTHSIDISNKVDNKPIRYWTNSTKGTIPLGAGQVILANCTNIIIENQNCSNSTIGIALAFSSSNIVENNTCNFHKGRYSDEGFGIYLKFANSNNIKNNTCSNNQGGIYLSHAYGNTITYNYCNSNRYYGIKNMNSNSNIIAYNICNSNIGDGINCVDSINNIIFNNICNSSKGSGINLQNASNNLIANNTCDYNYIDGICSLPWDEKGNNIFINNTCVSNNRNGVCCGDGNNIVNNTCFSNEADGISCRGENLISDNNCSFNDNGISCGSHNTIENNICLSNKDCGIRCSNRNIITNNTSGSNYFIGIFLRGDFNTVLNNTCSNNVDGLWFHRYNWDEPNTNNTIKKNIFSNNYRYGIYLSESHDNIITYNYFLSNINYAIFLSKSSKDNTIHKNTFIDNINGNIQVMDNGSGNSWNDSSKGNYWSDWPSPDSDKNDVIDIPYSIDGSSCSKDYYPLLLDFDPSKPVVDTGPDISIKENTTLQFDGSQSYSVIGSINYTWNFEYNGKVVRLHGPNPYFKFDIPGDYTVTLNVTDSQGNNAEDTFTITVKPEEDDTPHNNKPGERLGSPIILIFGGFFIFFSFVVGSGIIVLYRRRKKESAQTQEEVYGRINQDDRPILLDDDTDRENG